LFLHLTCFLVPSFTRLLTPWFFSNSPCSLEKHKLFFFPFLLVSLTFTLCSVRFNRYSLRGLSMTFPRPPMDHRVGFCFTFTPLPTLSFSSIRPLSCCIFFALSPFPSLLFFSLFFVASAPNWAFFIFFSSTFFPFWELQSPSSYFFVGTNISPVPCFPRFLAKALRWGGF